MASPTDPSTSPTLLGRLRRWPPDQEAWEQFFQRYTPRLYDSCRRWKLQDADAHEVTQMVLLRLTARMRDFEYDPSRSFRGWLMTLCHHAWHDLVTSRPNVTAGSEGEVRRWLDSLEARDDLARQLAEAYNLELLEEVMARVRVRVQPQTWAAYQLTAIEGLTGVDAAGRLNMKVTAVFKAKSNVQKLLQEEARYLERPGNS